MEHLDQNQKILAGIGVGSAAATLLLYNLSPSLFVLWVGIVGAALTWYLYSSRWQFHKDELQAYTVPTHVDDKDQKDCGDDISVYEQQQQQQQNSCKTNLKLGGPEIYQPWIHLGVPRKVDAALEDFLNHVLDKFIYDWYSKLSSDEILVDELRSGIRFLVAKILRRVKRVNIAEFLSKEIIPTVVTHLVQHVHSHRKVGRHNADRIKLRINRVHRSLYNREDELVYLKQLVISLSPHILPDNVQQCRLLKLLLEEILSGVVLFPVADKIADPDIINNLIIIFCDEEPPPVNPDPPSEIVEFLAHFASPKSDTQPILSPDLGRILNDQILMVSFMEVMKNNGGIRFLQFFLTLDNFKKELLTCSMRDSELSRLHIEACDMYRLFCDPSAHDHVHMGEDLQQEFRQLAAGGPEAVRGLQTNGEFLARAYDYLYTLMDSYYLPIFRHSTQYYTHLYGGKNDRPDPSPLAIKADRRSFSLPAKLKGSLRTSGSNKDLPDIDSSASSTPDRLSLQDEDVLDETIVPELHDLSHWSIEIPSINILPDSQGKPSYSFQVKVYENRITQGVIDEPDGPVRMRTSASVYRTYNDFYSLEQKLKQFHGDKMSAQLPPKKILFIFTNKDHEYLDSIKPKIEQYLETVLAMTDLKNSELLHNFLTVDDFSKCNTSEIRIDRVLKSVPGKLVKEKGQNLKSFLKTFQSSTVARPPRPDFSKVTQVHPDTENRKLSLIRRHLHNPLYERSHIRQPSNGVAVEPNNHLLTVSSQSQDHTSKKNKLSSITDCINRVAEEVFSIPKRVHVIFCAVTMVGKELIDKLVTWFISTKLDQVSEEHRIEALIHLLRDSLFYDNDAPRTAQEKVQRKEQALKDLLSFLPDIMRKVTQDKESFDASVEELFEVLQHAKLNKQLVFMLVDSIFSELFPELKEGDASFSSI